MSSSMRNLTFGRELSSENWTVITENSCALIYRNPGSTFHVVEIVLMFVVTKLREQILDTKVLENYVLLR